MTLAERFEGHRGHLRAVAYRLLGSFSEADDAVQEAWLRLDRADPRAIDNLGGWLTTAVARICLDMLRARRARREEPLPDPVIGPVLDPSGGAVVDPSGGAEPEREALLVDSIGLALMVVLDALAPAERLAFVLHDLFALPYDEIAPIVGRSPPAARQLASRARRRVRASSPVPHQDPHRQRAVVDAFLAAARGGDLAALIGVLDPEVVLRADLGPAGGYPVVRGAGTVAAQALAFAARADLARPARINGAAGLLVVSGRRPIAVLAFTVANERIIEIYILADRARLNRLPWAA